MKLKFPSREGAAEAADGSLGFLLRRLRRERGLRLEDLALRAGYTKGFLSKVENGLSAPPIATLLRLARALAVDPSFFFKNDGKDSRAAARDPRSAVHVPPEARAQVENAGAGLGYAYWALAAPRSHKAMEPFLITVKPEEVQPRKTFQHPGEEFIFVLKGRMKYRVGAENFNLGPGDSLYFEADRPHGPLPIGGPVTFLAIFHAPPRPSGNRAESASRASGARRLRRHSRRSPRRR